MMSEPPVRVTRVSGDKRPMPAIPYEPVKRRAPYAQTACDACRRRKGRCDGAQPCKYCVGRSFECCYSINHHDSRQPKTRQSSAKTTTDAAKRTADNSSINGLVATIQGHLDTLASQISPNAVTQGEAAAAASARLSMPKPTSSPQELAPRNRLSASVSTATATSPTASTTSKPSTRAKAGHYHGPTSPAFSLAAAHIQFKDRKHANVGATRNSGLSNALGDEGDSESGHEDVDHSDDDDSASSSQLARPSSHQALFRSLHLFHTTETIRLLRVYHEVIGELHPVCDIENLVGLIYQVHSASSSGLSGQDRGDIAVDKDDLLALNLALAIALIAEASPSSNIAHTIFEQCRCYIDAKITSGSKSIKDVVVTLMTAFYYLFKSESQLAWRMCGLAGRMAMELGLHSREASRYDQESSDWQEKLATLSCSLLVLDRQWSAATGYPPNFKECDFEMAKVSLAHTPYLREMMKFTLISHKFNEPISQVARGEYVDEEDIDLLNFQVENWRKRALENQNYIHPEKWESTTSAKPPPWATLLYLRANAVRGILMRPFFLSDEGSHVAAKKAWPGLELVSDSLKVLCILDRTTDVYKKQHPHFQHYVASSCALLFLIIVYTKKYGITPPESAAEYLRSTQESLEMALKLSAAYSQSSRASRHLWKRLRSVGEPLFRWGVLHEDNLRTSTAPTASSTTKHAEPRPPQSSVQDMVGQGTGWAQQKPLRNILPAMPSDSLSAQGMPISNTTVSSNDFNEVIAMNGPIQDDFSFDSLDPLVLGWWPMKSGGTWFADGLF